MPPVTTVGDSGTLYLAGAKGSSAMGGGGVHSSFVGSNPRPVPNLLFPRK